MRSPNEREMNMAENEYEKIPPRTPRYAAVMEEAGKRAGARAASKGGDAVVTISDVFEALCLIHPESFSLLTNTPVTLPKAAPAECDPLPAVVYHSPEVDKYLSPYGGVIAEVLSSFESREVIVDSLHIAGALLWEPTPEILNLLSVSGATQGVMRTAVTAGLRREAETAAAERRKAGLASSFENVEKIRKYLSENCFGQDSVINAVITQLAIAWGMPAAERGAKPLSFFFVGAPGTGKNHLTSLIQDAFESFLGIPRIRVVDFARFATEQLPMDLIGRDSNWKDGGHEGVLTGAAAANPRGVIVIENYERGHECAISYLDSILETGYAVDEFSKQNICFSGNVFIIITHKKEFADSDEFLKLVSKDGENPPRDKIVEGLVKFEPRFQSTLRLVDAPMLFRKHDFKSFFAIVKAKLSALARRFEGAYDVSCEFGSEDVLRLLMEMHPNVESAHPIISALESAILIPLQDWLLQHYGEFVPKRKIRIECDPLPDFEGAPERGAFDSFEEWMEERTKRRILRAKRLVFSHEIGVTDDAVVLKMRNISYTMMPSIEDAGYFSVTVPDVSFDDLVGVDIVKERVSEVLHYFEHPDKGVRPDTGIILYGPPGTGKTSVAKAIAKELGVPFILAMGADFSRQRMGEGVESVKKLFAAARRYGAVLFIDEIDGIGSREQEARGGHSEGARIINAFLTELDGFRARNMLVIGATNRYETLDEALIRPGRLSLKIRLGLLHKPEDRKKLIEGALKNARAEVSPELVARLVATTNSWSPANLIAMINCGIRIARREGREIEFGHFARARTVVTLGEDPQQPENSDAERHLVAVHEAGHAVTAVLRGIPFVQATIEGAGGAAGFVEHFGLQRFSTAKDLECMIDMCLGGRLAEKELLGEPSSGALSDFEHATALAADMIRLGLTDGNLMAVAGESARMFAQSHRPQIEAILQKRMGSVRELLHDHRRFLEAVTEALEAQKMLFEEDIRSIEDSLSAKRPARRPSRKTAKKNPDGGAR